MTVCIRCHRPLKRPTETGMGRVCAKTAAAVLRHERDLFGYDTEKAALAALQRVGVCVASAVAEAHLAVRAQFRAARVRLGVWSQ